MCFPSAVLPAVLLCQCSVLLFTESVLQKSDSGREKTLWSKAGAG